MKPLAQNTLIQNRYLIVQLIGKGGMGEVYLAVDQRLGSAVALKRTFFAGDEMLGNAFEREARTLARMRHPVLPKVSDHFGEGEEQYLVMEHISGDDLSKRLESAQKPFPISWVLFWADQLLDALSYLHTHEPPIIHRDIKPQNLKLTDENNIILLDFGLSKTSTGQTNISQSGSTGSVVGYTPHYAPMEQIRGIGTSARSDLYSLSATLYQLLTNTVPADALSRADSMLNGSPDPVQPLHELNPEVSKTVSDVVLKGMEVSQEKRFADAREMQKVLRKAFSDMQEAMSANTVAFNADAAASASLVEPQRGAESVSGARIDSTPGPAMPAGSPADTDLDATIAFDPTAGPSQPSQPSQPKQSEVKTEVFLAGSNSLPIPDREDSFTPPPPTPAEDNWAPPPPPAEANEFSETTDFSSLRSSEVTDPTVGDATEAAIDFDAPFVRSDVFPEKQTEKAPPPIAPAPVQPAKKASSKAALAFGGFAALVVLLVIGLGAGWYVYSNFYSATAQEEPTPTPEATLLPSPSPEPTLEAVANTDANTSSQSAITSNTNTSSEVTVAPTPAPTAQQPAPADTTASRPAATPSAARTPQARPASTTAPKATPKPKTSDRTVILQ